MLKEFKDIKVLGWDLDGTLYPATKNLSAEIVGLRNKRVAEKLDVDEATAEIEYKKILEKVGSNTKALETIGIDGKEFFSNMWSELDLSKQIHQDPKIAELFSQLNGYYHFLLSNSNRLSQIERKLSLIGLDSDVFDVIIDTVELNAFKPDSKPYLEAINRLNQKFNLEILPSDVLYIGDRDATDIRGAKTVGMKTCFVWGKSELAEISLPNVYSVVDILRS